MIRQSRAADIRPIARRMREIDRRECKAFGVTPRWALSTGLRRSDRCWTIEHDGDPLVMFGIGPQSIATGLGAPWLLGVDRREAKRELVAAGPAMVRLMAELYPRMVNWSHADNLITRRWLEGLGFDFDSNAVTINGEPMVRFSYVHPPCGSGGHWRRGRGRDGRCHGGLREGRPG